MTLFWTILFYISAGALFHTYAFYPLLLWALSPRKKAPRPAFGQEDAWPPVSVLLSVYNEEAVIAKKLRSLFESEYPAGQIHFFIGSDASSDHTEQIILSASGERGDVHFFPFPQRRGKPAVLNDLAERALHRTPASKGHLLLITDANVFLEPNTIRLLARHFKDSRIGLVDAHMINTGQAREGISRSETQYIKAESLLKFREGQLWGAMIGPFGGCYMLRSDLFTPIPPHFLVDDFYLAMRAFEKGTHAINDLEALCYEAVSHEIKEEFRRKSRIAAGNYQNLSLFGHLVWPPWSGLGFSFLSHKILRWFGPFFLLLMLFSSLFLALEGNIFFTIVLIIQLALWGLVPLIDQLLLKWGLHGFWLRSIRYFLAMNIALFAGFIRYVRGVKSGAWEPPKRV